MWKNDQSDDCEDRERENKIMNNLMIGRTGNVMWKNVQSDDCEDRERDNKTLNNCMIGRTKICPRRNFCSTVHNKVRKDTLCYKNFLEGKFLASLLFLAFLKKLNFTNFFEEKCLSQSKEDNNFRSRKFFSIVFLTLHNNPKALFWQSLLGPVPVFLLPSSVFLASSHHLVWLV